MVTAPAQLLGWSIQSPPLPTCTRFLKPCIRPCLCADKPHLVWLVDLSVARAIAKSSSAPPQLSPTIGVVPSLLCSLMHYRESICKAFDFFRMTWDADFVIGTIQFHIETWISAVLRAATQATFCFFYFHCQVTYACQKMNEALDSNHVSTPQPLTN